MAQYEIVIVTKEYRTIHIEAEDENSARDKAWDELTNGIEELPIIGQVNTDTDIYVEGVVGGYLQETTA